jgi:hypothetical protein
MNFEFGNGVTSFSRRLDELQGKKFGYGDVAE